MKAAIVTRYGPPEVLEVRDVPDPTPRENEVLIRIEASEAAPSDCAFRSANPFIVRFFAGLTKPKHEIIGTALAGEVVAIGQDITLWKPGDRVYGATATDFGACAELKCLPEDGCLALMPANLSFGEAIAVGDGFLTAMPFLRDEARLQPGQRLLVNGASGTVGSMAVQLGKHLGAYVTGVCSGRNVELVRNLGADEVIDYTREDFTSRAAAWDVIFDAVGKSSFSRCARALAANGVYMTTVPSFGIVGHMLVGRNRAKTGQRALIATTGLRPTADKRKDLELLTRLCEAGIVRPVIDSTLPLERIADAHRYVETGRKRGSLVIDIAGRAAEGRRSAIASR